jgi:hypothetical protein
MDVEEKRLIDQHGGVLCNMEKKIKQTLNLRRGRQGNPRAMWDSLVARSRRRLLTIWPKLRRFYETHGHLRVPKSDPDLGSLVNGIRNRKNFLQHVDFKAWLDEHDFVYDERRTHLEVDVWPKFKRYYQKHGHLNVPRNDADLGKTVSHIRSENYFLQHADFKAWLDERGFVYDARRAHLELDIWPKFKLFYETHGHLNVRGIDPDLGSLVHNIRKQKNFLQHIDFAMWLWCACFRMHMTDNTKNRSRWEQVFSAFT